MHLIRSYVGCTINYWLSGARATANSTDIGGIASTLGLLHNTAIDINGCTRVILLDKDQKSHHDLP